MARRRRGRDADTSVNANLERELLRPVVMPSALPLSTIDNFLADELPHDRRLFSFGEPETYSLVTAPPVGHAPFSREHVSFGDPDTVAICQRRKVRKEVLIARGGRGAKRPKRKWYSKIRC